MDTELLGRLLAMASLLAATIEYGEIVQRRVKVRQLEADRLAAQASGLRGLVRVFLTDADSTRQAEVPAEG